MDPDRWRQIAELYDAAVERDAGERAAFLRAACVGDPALAHEVQSLLDQSASMSFLTEPAITAAARLIKDQPDALLIGRRLGIYEVQSLLGVGGMGEVYRARDAKLGRDVALKVLPSIVAADHERLVRFEREARLLAALNHSHIGAIYGVEESDGVPALVLELIEGPTLAERLASGPLPAKEALVIAHQVAEALEAAHARGIVHRDLKPANIKFTGDGAVKVLDFGLAKAMLGDTPGSDRTQSSPEPAGTREGLLLGTIGYMSPEQATGRPTDKRTDIWAFGCIVFEMLTGRRAFEGGSIEDSLAAMLTRQPDWQLLPPHIPGAIRRLVQRCLERDLHRRIADVAAVLFVLEEINDLASGAQTSAIRRPRATAITGIAITVVVLALAALGLYSRRVRQPAPQPAPNSANEVEHPSARSTPSRKEPEREPILSTKEPERQEAPLAEAAEGQPTRFSILPPEPTRFRELAVSPDGRHIAFIAEAPDDSTQLWVRSLDDSQLLQVGIENPSSPFWSPDSQVVGFFTVDKLQKVKLGSQVPEPIADVHAREISPRPGASWNRDGLILFTDEAGLHEVRETGGPVGDLLAVSTEMWPAWPSFLPDGVHFVFTSKNGGGIYLGSLRSSARQQIVSARSRATFIAPNRLIFQNGTALQVQPLDQQTWKPIGTPITLAEGLAEDQLGYPTYGGTATTLAYLARPLTELVWVDRQGARVASLTGLGNDTNPVLSPDDRKVAFERPRQDSPGTTDIFVLDLGTGIASQFTFGASSRRPVWSPDSRRITFTSVRSGGGTFEKVASGAGSEALLLPSSANEWAPTPYSLCDRSPDGSSLLQIVYPRLYIQPLMKGAKAIALAGERGPFDCGQFSPDGRFVAYSDLGSNLGNGIGVAFLSSPLQIIARTMVWGDGLTMPKWRRDGQELFYISLYDAKLMAVQVDARNKQALGSPVPLFDMPGIRVQPGQEPSFSPDRMSYAVAKDGQRFIIRRGLNDRSDPATVIVNWSATASNNPSR